MYLSINFYYPPIVQVRLLFCKPKLSSLQNEVQVIFCSIAYRYCSLMQYFILGFRRAIPPFIKVYHVACVYLNDCIFTTYLAFTVY